MLVRNVNLIAEMRYLNKLRDKRCYSNVCSDILDISEMPAPRGLPLIGTTLSLLAAGSTPKLHRYVDKRHKQLGPIYKEKIGPVSCVFISDPEAMRSVFSQEGKYPIHFLPEAWTTYNEIYGCSRGLFFMNGEEWLHFRRIMNTILLKGDLKYIENACETVSDILIKKIKMRSASGEELPDLEDVLYKWSLDVILSILLGPEKYREAQEDIEVQVKELASMIHLVFKTSAKLALIPAKLAAQYKIPSWRKFERSVNLALNSANDLVQHLTEHYPNGDGLLGKMQENMLVSEVSRIVTDLILAAGDTTAYSMEWILYLVAKNGHVQDKLRKEMVKWRNKEEDDASSSTSPLLKNVIRESLRLYPVAPFLTRILPENVTVKGYNIPAGTPVIMSIFTSGRDSTYYRNPEQFLPDRWLRNDTSGSGTVDTAAKQLASLPFAIGARSCIGKKIAETQLQNTLAKLVENFKIELCNEEEVDVILKMVAVPSEPIRLKFKEM